ncbi:MAG TPA: hypothetical protein VEL07_02950 [Planctomycetota bacterium]|nr:hypothetical protein [Planctomycetota bacterium]
MPMPPSIVARRGAALPAVFALALLIGGLLILSSERVLAVKRLQDIGLAKQQAAYAAEAVAAMKEVQMVDLAASNDLVGLDTRPDPNSGAVWFGQCLVRWRIEPVRIENPDGRWTVNPVADLNLLDPNDPDYLKNYEYYVYRISTEAHYLADGDAGDRRPFEPATGEPVDGRTYDPLNRVCAMQAQRVVQLRLNSLFRYAIFYAAEGTTGDLEFWVGTGINVRGAVHSNGAIYIGGQANAYRWGDYHNACSLGGRVRLGGAGAERISICGVDGLFRMRKGCNVVASRDAGHPYFSALGPGDMPDPMLVPLDGVGGMSGTANLNGDTPSSTLHELNGRAFTSANDSRCPTWASANAFAPYVRDGQTGGTVVKTLANIPQLAGRPFEHHRFAADDARLYWKSAALHEYTILPTADTVQLYYTDFANDVFTPTDQPLDGAGVPRTPIFARNLPLYDLDAGDPNSPVDVWPDGGVPPVNGAGTLNEGFAQAEARGHYLAIALDGEAAATTTGLTIRERPRQLAARFDGAKPVVTDAAYAGNFALFRAAYRSYLASQYMVILGGVDVTDAFFGQVAAAAAETDFIATEDQFVNVREATAMQVFHGVPRATGMPGARPYSVNVLTLNLRATQDWLRNTDWSTIVAGGTGKAKDRFNGVLYAHRTRRSETYHPLDRPKLVLDPYDLPNTTYTLPPAVDWPFRVREGSGAIETFHCAVRLRQGRDINWAHGAGPAPLGTSGLTVITPNMCYVQGDYNVVPHVDAAGIMQTPPCAIFADGVTALSNAWSDAAHQTVVTTATAGSATTFNLSYVINNVPTDDITADDEGSGAVANVVRFLENWGGRSYNFRGSLVVMNRMRYSYTTLGASHGPLNMSTSYYSPPTRNITFNTDLLSRAGQPPVAPFGVQVIRTVSTMLDVTQ